jgi:putative ABC transport system permease protein
VQPDESACGGAGVVKKKKNPLRRRVLREIQGEMGKYIVVFLMLALTISVVSGYLVAVSSMIHSYNESFETYNIEDGHFVTAKQLNRAQRKSIQELGITIYDLNYVEQPLRDNHTMRIYADRTEVNTVCLMQGKLPDETGEIAIDRMYADNNKLLVGDSITSSDGSQTWTITGLVALSDYSALFQNNGDSMFDAVQFGVAVVTQEEFDGLNQDHMNYCYAWKYDQPVSDEKEQKERGEDLLKELVGEVNLESFLPRYQNQAISYSGEDLGGDKALVIALLYIIIAIMAFVFGITINNTITKEANVIGTLRASGYTKGELVRHYMAPPILVTLISALVGNVIGYTVMKDKCAGIYYSSYSLTTYTTLWNAEAFVLTTIVPILLMVVITFGVLWSKLSLAPLKFLRRDLSRSRNHRALHLPKQIPFFTRFRLRVMGQNAGSYVVMAVGILFANLLLLFGLVFPPVLAHYQETIQNNMLADYQYMLQVPLELTREDHKLENLVAALQFQSAVETENEDAEAFSAYSLRTTSEKFAEEDVILYGVEENSSYISIDPDKVYVSEAYADKYNLSEGDTITLKEEYEDDVYTFTVDAIYPYEGGVCVFMGQDALNSTFDLGDGYFCGYFSSSEITDIDERYISSVVDLDALTKVTRQLTTSTGGMMGLVDGFAVIIFVVLIYLLSKLVIEKNAQSISMAKILGYSNGEIARLYIFSTTIVVAVLLVLSLPVESFIMDYLFRMVMTQMMSGWLPLWIDPVIYWKMLGLGFGSYVVVAALELRKIKRVPMDEALKNVE